MSFRVILSWPLLALALLAVGCGPNTGEDRAIANGVEDLVHGGRGTLHDPAATVAIRDLVLNAPSETRIVGHVFGEMSVSDAAAGLVRPTGCAALQHMRDTGALPSAEDWVGFLGDALIGEALQAADIATASELLNSVESGVAASIVSSDGNVYLSTVDSVYADWSCGRASS